jgi:hypothetical protein
MVPAAGWKVSDLYLVATVRSAASLFAWRARSLMRSVRPAVLDLSRSENPCASFCLSLEATTHTGAAIRIGDLDPTASAPFPYQAV